MGYISGQSSCFTLYISILLSLHLGYGEGALPPQLPPGFRPELPPDVPPFIVPPDCGPDYMYEPDYVNWSFFLKYVTKELVYEGTQRFPKLHPVIAHKIVPSNLHPPYLFWGVVKCYQKEGTMDTSLQCYSCLENIRIKLLYYLCQYPGEDFYTAQYGSYLSQGCYFRYTTIEIFPEDSCPLIPDPETPA